MTKTVRMSPSGRNEIRVRMGWCGQLTRGWLLAALVAPGFGIVQATDAAAQGTRPPIELTLQAALETARAHNPGYLSRAENQGLADWRVREAYGSFLPSVNSSGSVGYTEPGIQRFGTVELGRQNTDWYTSSYALTLNWQLGGDQIFQLRNARAQQTATDADITASGFDLESAVTLQYMSALRARDQMEVALRQRERAEQNRAVVQARVESDAAAPMDLAQADVELGRAEVAVIRGEQAYRAETLRLQEQMGMQYPEGVELTSRFEVFSPPWGLDELLDQALSRHPSLQAFRARESAGRAGVRQARSGYFPSLNVVSQFSGNTIQALNDDFVLTSVRSSMDDRFSSCQQMNLISQGLSEPLPGHPRNCDPFRFSDEIADQALAANRVFPFDFTRNPAFVSVQLSLPVFTGFSRQRQVEEARVQARGAEYARRGEELRIRTVLTESLDNLNSAVRVVEIEQRNRAVAEDRVNLARQRYALGAADILELSDAEASLLTADRDHLNAVYEFHLNLSVLEAAAGQSLRRSTTASSSQEN